ncbi:MAG: LamG domain-containing protein, partial [Candidatus Paceibacterota bacterium]
LNGILESTKYRSNPSLSKPNLPGVLSYGSNQALSPLYNTSGLVGYWNFDNNVSDQSGNNNNGTWYGTSTTRYVGGKVGSGAGTFNGTNDYVQILNSSSLNPIDGVTISAWVDTSIQAMSAILYKNDSGKYLWLYDNWCNPGCSGSRLYLNDGITSFDNFSTVLPVLNKWRLVVGAYDKTKSGIYSDGVLLISNLRTLNPIDIPYPFYIKPNGLIDDVRIYNRALSASEVQALYSATK